MTGIIIKKLYFNYKLYTSINFYTEYKITPNNTYKNRCKNIMRKIINIK